MKAAPLACAFSAMFAPVSIDMTITSVSGDCALKRRVISSDFEAVDVRELDVHQHQLRLQPCKFFQCAGACCRRVYLELREAQLEEFTQRSAERFVVLDDHHDGRFRRGHGAGRYGVEVCFHAAI